MAAKTPTTLRRNGGLSRTKAFDVETGILSPTWTSSRRPDLSARYGITELPTLILFDQGIPIERFLGMPPERELKARLEGVLADYSEAVVG